MYSFYRNPISGSYKSGQFVLRVKTDTCTLPQCKTSVLDIKSLPSLAIKTFDGLSPVSHSIDDWKLKTTHMAILAIENMAAYICNCESGTWKEIKKSGNSIINFNSTDPTNKPALLDAYKWIVEDIIES